MIYPNVLKLDDNGLFKKGIRFERYHPDDGKPVWALWEVVNPVIIKLDEDGDWFFNQTGCVACHHPDPVKGKLIDFPEMGRFANCFYQVKDIKDMVRKKFGVMELQTVVEEEAWIIFKNPHGDTYVITWMNCD